MRSVLEEVIDELLFRDRLQRIPVRVSQEQLLPEALPRPFSFFTDSPFEAPVVSPIAKDIAEAVRTAQMPEVHYAQPVTVKYDHAIAYRSDDTAAAGSFYVHVPSWVKVSRAPFHVFGSSLFGLAYTSTGEVQIREDLEGDAFSEVLQHEVFHQLYPSCSEAQIRQFTLARFGSRAVIHQTIGPGI